MSRVNIPIWFVIFPENKKYNYRCKEILTLNKKFSAEHKLPEFSNVLIPKIETTHAAICSYLKKINAIYDITIAYRDLKEPSTFIKFVPSFNQILKSNTYEIHVHIKRITKEELIKTDLKSFDFDSRDKTAQFLINLFFKKDKNLDIFYHNDLKANNEMTRATNFCEKNLNFLSIVPGVVIFSSLSVLLLNNRLGRKLFIKTYAFSSVLTYIVIKCNSYFNIII